MAEKLCELKKKGGGKNNVMPEEIGYVHTNSTANQTITVSKDYAWLFLAQMIRLTPSTLTITNNKSLTPTMTSSSADNIMQIFKDVPAGTIFTCKASQAYYYNVAVYGIE